MVGHSASDVCRQKVAYYVRRMILHACIKAHAIEPVIANWCVNIGLCVYYVH